MLLQLSVENYKSIHKEIVFSMLKAKDNIHDDYVRTVGNFDVLPNALIIGTNGAGKSNLFKTIVYIQKLLKNKSDMKVLPHKLSDKDKPTKIDIQFLVDQTRYVYGIDVLHNEVVFEYLTVYKQEEEIQVFERNYQQFKYIDEDILDECTKSTVCLPLLNKLLANSYIKNAYFFLTEKIQVILSDQEVTLFKTALLNFKEAKNQNIVNQIIKVLDIGIKYFSIKNDDILVNYDQLEMNILEESEGTRKLFVILAMLSEVLLNGKILFFDELEKNLHLTLVKHIIYLFNKQLSNQKNAQLIFSTHNTSLLNLSTFRRDQVWFMEKNLETMTTELYSLYNIINVQDNEDIEKGYILGKYGATFKFSHDGVKLYGK